MQVEVKDILEALSWFENNLPSIRFYITDNEYVFGNMPTIDVWNQGVIELESSNVAELEKRLKLFNITPLNINSANNKGTVAFRAKAGDDIIRVLSVAMKKRDEHMKARNMEILHDEINTRAKQLPYVKASLFSRGVNKLVNSVEVLRDIVKTQQKHARQH